MKGRQPSTKDILAKIKDGSLSAQEGLKLINEIKKNKNRYQKDSEIYFYKPLWEGKELLSHKEENDIKNIIIIDNDEQSSETLRGRLNLNDDISRIINIKNGNKFSVCLENTIEMNFNIYEDYHMLLYTLQNSGFTPDAIIYNQIEADTLEQALDDGIYSVYYMVKALSELKINSIKQFLYVYINKTDISNPSYEAIKGYAKSLKLIWPKLNFSRIQINDTITNKERSEIVYRELMASEDNYEEQVKYVQNKRYIRAIKPCSLKKSDTIKFREKGVYLITGGAGGLGKIFARHLIKKCNARIIVTGRSILDDNRLKEIQNLITDSLGTIEYMPADVCDLKQMEKLVNDIKSKYGSLNGVIHAAGKPPVSDITKKSFKEFQDTLNPKIYGTRVLDEVTSNEQLDFFIMFSSTSAFLGDFGQCDYAIGNSFIDSYALMRKSDVDKGLRFGETVSINWPLWKDGGMHGETNSEQFYLQTSGMRFLETEEGLMAFDNIISDGRSNISILVGDKNRIDKLLNITQIQNQTKQKIELDINQLLEKDIKSMISLILKLSENRIDITENLANFGFESVSLKRFADNINEKFNIEISPTIFFSYSRVDKLILYLKDEFENEIKDYYYKANKRMQKVNIEKTNDSVNYEETIEGKVVEKRIESIKKDQSRCDCAVVGISGVFPGCENIEELWENLVKKKDLTTEVPSERWDWRIYHSDQIEENKSISKWGGFINNVDKFDNKFFNISPREAELMDPQQRIFIETVWSAIEDAGYKVSNLSGEKVGVFTGVQFFDYQTMLNTKEEMHAQIATGNAHTMISNRISYLFNFRGPSEVVNTACSSSLVALKKAADSVMHGDCNIAIAGGVSLNISPYNYLIASQLGMLSPDGRCKPFDKSANGFVKGEGIGAIIIKPLEKAIQDRDNIYGVIVGTAENHGGRANSLTSPNIDAQVKLLIDAYTKAQIDPSTVTYIETHGTGTELGDPIEVEALKIAFDKMAQKSNVTIDQKNYCGLGSIKSNIGHLEPASGIAGVIKVLLAMRNKSLPGTVHFKEQNPYIKTTDSPFYIVDETKKWEILYDDEGKPIPRRAGVSSFGFGGANAHIIFEEYTDNIPTKNINSSHKKLMVLSAKNEERLKKYAIRFIKYLHKIIQNNNINDSDNNFIDDLAFTLQEGREAMEARVAMVVSSLDEFRNLLEAYINDESNIQGLYVGNIKKTKTNEIQDKENDTLKSTLEIAITNSDYNKVAELWVNGVEVDWNSINEQTSTKRISAPTYPFERKRHWIDGFDSIANSVNRPLNEQNNIPDNTTISVDEKDELIAIQDWKKVLIANSEGSKIKGTFVVLLNASLTERIVEDIKSVTNADWIIVNIKDNSYLEENSEKYLSRESYSQGKNLAKKLLSKYAKIDGIIDFSDLYLEEKEKVDINEGKIGFIQTFLKDNKNNKFNIYHFTNGLQAFNVDEVSINGAVFAGLIRMLSSEYDNVNSMTIDISYKDTSDIVEALKLAQIYSGRSQLCIRNGSIYVPYYRTMKTSNVYKNRGKGKNIKINSEDAYVIAGGTSGLGLKLAGYLARSGARKLILMGIRSIPEKNKWEMVEELEYPIDVKNKVKGLREIEKMGVTVEVYTGPLTEKNKLKNYFEEMRRKYSRIGGVINCAWKSFDELPYFVDKEIEDIIPVLEPKVQGTINLAEIFQKDKPDFFILCSSVASAIPSMGVGNCHYAMANYFLDCYGAYMNKRGYTGFKTINWICWGETGAATAQKNLERLAELGIYPMTNNEGISCFEEIMESDHYRFLAGRLDKKTYEDNYLIESRDNFEEILGREIETYHRNKIAEFENIRQEQMIVEKYIGLKVLEYFQKAGVFKTKDDIYNIRDLQKRLFIIEKYKRMLKALLRILEKRGYIELKNESIRYIGEEYLSNGEKISQEAEEIKIKLYDNNSDYIAIVKLLDLCFENYYDILSGKVQSTDIIFPKGSMSLVEGIYSSGKIVSHFSKLLGKYISCLIRNKLEQGHKEKIKILEIGAGTGGTSRYIVEEIGLYSEYIEYYYTDISPGFTSYGQNKLKNHDFIKYKVLNIEKDIEKQGFYSQEFDIVFATNVIHATKNITNTIANIKRLIKNNGTFLLNEMMSIQDFATAIFGLLDGWWQYNDEHIRLIDAPLLTLDSWKNEFQKAGLMKNYFFGIPSFNSEEGIAQGILSGISDGVIDMEDTIIYSESFDNGSLNMDIENGKGDRTKKNMILKDNMVQGLTQKIKNVISDVLKTPEHEIEEEVSLGEYGVDSIVTGMIVKKLEESLGISINPSIILENDNIASLVKYFKDNHSQEIKELVDYNDAKDTEFIIKSSTKDNEQISEKTSKIAVIGMACNFPDAPNKEVFWGNIKRGISSIREVPSSRWDKDKYYSKKMQKGKIISKWGGFIEDIEYFDPEYFGFKKEDAVHIDPLVRQFLEVSVQAVRDAGYEKEELSNKKAGVFASARVSNYTDMMEGFIKNSIVGLGQNFVATHISRFFNLKGPSMVIDTACSSSLVSIHSACQSILTGECELAFAGGVEILLNQRPYLILSQMGGFSPDGKCYAFDQRANGFVPGEGCGVVLLKSLEKAIQDGDRIYAIIDGSAVNSDGRTMGITTPNPSMQKEVILDALRKNNTNPNTLSYIEAHGTGTLIGDPIELKALTEVFRMYTNDCRFCAVGSVKPNIGHLFLASGVASFIKTVLSIYNKQIPPNLNCETPNPRFKFEGSPFYINRELKDWNTLNGLRRAGISSFGLGGTNAHVIVSELEEEYSKNYITVRKPLNPVEFNKSRYWFDDENKIDIQDNESIEEETFMLKLYKK